MNLNNIKRKFFHIYNNKELNVFFSPSRVNLIGEHIDYNGGYVLPCALELGTYGCVRKRCDKKIRLASGNIELKVEIDINYLNYEEKHDWANYPKSVIYFMKKEGYNVSGMDIFVEGNIPNGAGLSSSASLELLIAEMINIMFNDGKISKMDLIRICQRAENDYIGVKCGIMDQFAVARGKKNCGILLNCSNLDFKYIDMDAKDYRLVIMNTNKKRQLNESDYNKRRTECEKALSILRNYKEIENICQLTIGEYEKMKKYLNEQSIKNRVHHVVYENQRVLKACNSLEEGDMKRFGEFLIESHESLRKFYEVTGKELDTIVGAAINQDSCIGARMTGAGFGGCAIAFVEKEKIEEFIKNVDTEYREKIGYNADFYVTGIGDGTRQLILE